MEIPVELSKIIINEMADQQVIVLKELDGDRNVPIVIGMGEILAIDRRIKGFQLPRPMTHDLLRDVIEKMNGSIAKVVVCDLDNGTYYARLHINLDGEELQVDSRPSDAIALTAGLNVPLFVSEQVFEKM